MDHEYLSDYFLKRPPGNFCIWCGKRIVVSCTFSKNFVHYYPDAGKPILLGYGHKYNCLIEPDEETQV